MKMVRVYLTVFVVCLGLGLGFVILTPKAAHADICGQCWIYSDCWAACNQEKYPNQSSYGSLYSPFLDYDCTGPYNCRFQQWGCHICGA
jgi:hypothetical protein